MLSTSIAGSQKTAPVLDFALKAETKYKYFNTEPSLKMSEKPANVNRGIGRKSLALRASAPERRARPGAHGANLAIACADRLASREPY